MKRRFCTQSVDCIQQFIRVNAALGLLSANVDLEQNILSDTMLCGLFCDRFAKMNRTDRLDQRDLADQKLHLIGLERADKLQVRSFISVLFILFKQLLHTVFTAHLDACANRFLDAFRIIHLARGNQYDVFRLFSCFFRCTRYPFLYLSDAFMQLISFLFCHVFTTVLSFRSVPRTMT